MHLTSCRSKQENTAGGKPAGSGAGCYPELSAFVADTIKASGRIREILEPLARRWSNTMADQLIRVNSENYVMASDVLASGCGRQKQPSRRRQAATASMLNEIKPASSR